MSYTCIGANRDKWKFYQDAAKEWRWNRTASNGNILGASTEGYMNRSECEANARRNGMDCNPI